MVTFEDFILSETMDLNQKQETFYRELAETTDACLVAQCQ